ncbi:L-lactate permease [Dethiosulfatarculus sandiegensis]|uniref:L-lactate permease n=1 Tax=Dethiosulfatarculus sandiegensis TaxID=1429043 RepID=A0A0D2HQU1_9BACT|nr:L-lactate permease [Dethiosulfatarculus sandiegensis]KIX12843.1 hypothetical protein X474_17285 [Dethiosulfatarculus sandiegensis]
MDYVFLFKWLLAFSPIAVVLILMIGFNWGGGRAGAAGWFTALIVAVAFFGAGSNLLAFAQTKGILLSIYVLYIVWMALLLYNVVQDTGAIETIGQGIQKLTSNRIIQLLILGWVFSSFLQGVAGFGVPIAVVGPLLMGLGFPAAVSVAAPAIGHSWSAFFLGGTAYLCGLAFFHFYGGFKALKEGLPAILIIGTVTAATQYSLAVSGLWTLAGFVPHFFMLGLQLYGIKIFVRLTRIPLYVLIPSILVLCSVGSFSIHNRFFDIWVLVIFGLMGYAMAKIKLPLAPMILGVILGPMAESNFCRALMSENDLTLFITRPISAFFLVLSVLSLLMPLYKSYRAKKKAKVSAAA